MERSTIVKRRIAFIEGILFIFCFFLLEIVKKSFIKNILAS